jgi:hypothetical protein
MGRTVTCQSPVHTEENILRQVLGFRSVSREPVANVKDASAVTTHKFLPGRPVALEALLDQLGILLQRFISLITCYGARRVCKPAALSKSRLAAHLGLPTMERKMLSKCSPKDQTLVANRSDSHLTHRRCKTQARQSRPPSVHPIGRRFSSQGAGWQEASRRASRVKAKSVYHSI